MIKTLPLEIGVVILPDEATSHEAERLGHEAIAAINRTSLSTHYLSNIPHISLFHMTLTEATLTQAKDILLDIAKETASFPIQMDNTLTAALYYVFWNAHAAKNCAKINALLQQVVERLYRLRAPELLQQIADFYEHFSLEQKKLTDKYGFPFSQPNVSFNPHITVVYNTGIDRQDKEMKNRQVAAAIQNIRPLHNCQFTANTLALVELGYYGNITKIIETFSLS